VAKGKQVYIEGRLKSRTYQAQNGETRFSIDVTCSEIQFLGGGAGAPAQGQEDQELVGVGQDDLPF